MMLDSIVIFGLVIGLVLYFCAQVILAQIMDKSAVTALLMRSFVASYLPASVVVGYALVRQYPQYSLLTLVAIFIVWTVMILFFLMDYIQAIFGITVTSLRIRLLYEIGNAETTGIAEKELERRYNIQTILRTRLQRMIQSGELKQEGAHYIIPKGKFSYFLIHGFLHRLMLRAYRGSDQTND